MSIRLAVDDVKQALVQGKIPLSEIDQLQHMCLVGFRARLGVLEKRWNIPVQHGGQVTELDAGPIEE